MTFKKLPLAAAAIAGLVAAATLPHDASAQVGAQIFALTDAYNASGWEPFSSLSESPGNIVLSPYSIGSAMSMALSGARGDTALGNGVGSQAQPQPRRDRCGERAGSRDAQ
jgi:hypothetical protein